MIDAGFEDELACQRLVTRYFRALDAGDAHAVADLFSQGGVWRRPGSDAAGYEAIRAEVLKRPSNVVVRHHVSNIDVHVIDAERASGLSYYKLYRHEMGDDDAAPFATDGPVRIGDNLHRFVKEGGRWKIEFTQARPLFATATRDHAK